MKTRLFRMGLAVLSLAAGFTLAGVVGPAMAQQNVTLALPAQSLLFAPAYIAAERGYFREAGIEPKIVYVAGPGVLTAVLGKSADFAMISGGIQIAAAVRNQKLVAIANTQDRFTTDIVVRKPVADKLGAVPPGDALARIRALKGLTIGIDAVNGLPHSFLRYLARKAGMNPETDFTITALQPQAMVAAMKSGTIEAMAFSPPFSLTAVNDGGALWITGPDVDLPEMKTFPYNVVLVRPDYCQAEAAACRGFTTAIGKAVALMRSDPAASLAALGKTFDRMEPEALRQSFAIFAKYTRTDLGLTEDMYRNAVAFDRAGGVIPETAAVPPASELYAPSLGR
ncbi:ABC-type nitrate/sulfonate/bicarbonate transport system substrate-binding protein [Bosea sp. OAE752]|uniref:ABC transporter substrate-binding protein n=1 Tax=Bosea sp. OAE752 TaxID=2663873 RepID=UPI003D237DA3